MNTQKKVSKPVVKPSEKPKNLDLVQAWIRTPKSVKNVKTGNYEAVDKPFMWTGTVRDWLAFLRFGITQGQVIKEVIEIPDGVPASFDEFGITSQITALEKKLNLPLTKAVKSVIQSEIDELNDELKTLKTK